jgi:N-acetylmuramoyl-L-alanine amidase
LAAVTLRRTGLAALLCAGLVPGSAGAGESDREAFQAAERARRALEGSGARMKSRGEWDRVIGRYREVVRRFPRSGYSDNALLLVGDLSHQVADRFGLSAYDDEAVRAWRSLAREYSSSRHCERALYAAWQVESRDSRARGEASGREYLARFASTSRAEEVRRYLAAQDEPRGSVSQPAPGALADVMNLRFWSGESTTRVVLDLEQAVPVKYDRLHDPERLYLDLIGTRLAESLTDRTFPVGDGLLEQIRVGQNRPEAVRVVLDFKKVQEHRIFYLKAPARLVIDVKGEGDPAAARRAEAAPPPTAAPPAMPAPEAAPAAPPTPNAGEATPAGWTRGAPPSPRTAAGTAERDQRSAPEPAPDRRADAGTRPAASPPSAVSGDAAPEASPPESPEANTDGSFSIARQLGLGARRIVIDAGHGGHDPGSIGPGGLREKDVVLDVALRLERLLREQLGTEVVMTRRNDVFIPLEERTAIANSKAADLFLSIHANSARNRSARGIETYYLSFAADPHAEELAARENSISRATLGDLQELVKAITLNSKLHESRDFAKAIQSSMIRRISPHYSAVRDRGVRTAPLYVLIGANMPSVLAELGFVSNPTEEKQLRAPAHRDVVAQSLLHGVERYLGALNRTQARQLTASGPAPTVEGDEARR